jgi:hypothetical protein
MTFEEYLAQFSGVESSPEIVIETDEDIQAFKEMYREKWANDHSKVIQEWRELQAAKEQKPDD